MRRKRWVRCEDEDEIRCRISEGLGISPVVAQILVNRGIREMAQAKEFLEVGPRWLHDPFLLPDMDRAVDRVLKAMDLGEKIVIYGDYDVDGVTASALYLQFFRSRGIDAGLYIPHRMTEGYGLNAAALERIREEGGAVVITADCGTTATAEVERGQALGLDLIVTDHHETSEALPKACAIVNPHRRDSVYPFKGLTGVGVALKLVQGILTRLISGGSMSDGEFPRELYEYLDLVTLGTVADVAPIMGENRFFVKEGLQRLTQEKRPGIAALKEVSGQAGMEAGVGMVGFALAPRINAAGRLEHADAGVRLLVTQDRGEAIEIARRLDLVNRERQKIEEKIRKEAREMVLQTPDLDRAKVLVLASESWHPGVIGIVASKIAEEFYRPTVMIAVNPEGIGKGSARSIPAFHLYEALESCRPVLEAFGGHKYAAGLTVRKENIPSLRERLSARSQEMLTDEDFIPRLKVDMEVDLEEINFTLLKEMELLSPFG
ncbi:MAG: single-stranded-DNA-specific exonuclease RecJ, partial [Nitrospirae bacterium]|nr:single-stranded-DNA-specific exonuclease RecJ [Nitrospirota bacterium]